MSTSVALTKTEQCEFRWVQTRKGEGYFIFHLRPGCTIPREANQRADVRIVDHDGGLLKKEKTTK